MHCEFAATILALLVVWDAQTSWHPDVSFAILSLLSTVVFTTKQSVCFPLRSPSLLPLDYSLYPLALVSFPSYFPSPLWPVFLIFFFSALTDPVFSFRLSFWRSTNGHNYVHVPIYILLATARIQAFFPPLLRRRNTTIPASSKLHHSLRFYRSLDTSLTIRPSLSTSLEYPVNNDQRKIHGLSFDATFSL